jgi:hypothetical protein
VKIERFKKSENLEYFNYFGSMIINAARCKGEMKSGIAMTKAAFNKKKSLFKNKLDLNLRKNKYSGIFVA